jgi:hypothetical protein
VSIPHSTQAIQPLNRVTTLRTLAKLDEAHASGSDNEGETDEEFHDSFAFEVCTVNVNPLSVETL